MSLPELFLIAAGLSMDAFAVAVCKGLSMKKTSFFPTLAIALWFGVFQGIMPVLGYLLGCKFQYVLVTVDHWITFALLGIIGANMIREAAGKETETDGDTGFRTMFPLAVATSIDALAVGVTFAFLRADIVFAAAVIGITTFLLSLAGVKAGALFGARYKAKAEITGGILLILLGAKILLEHLGWFPF
ncbi:MAG: manganese efflux pump MntP family protein [Clostridia bacterium]